jgi:hypothetical protein
MSVVEIDVSVLLESLKTYNVADASYCGVMKKYVIVTERLAATRTIQTISQK